MFGELRRVCARRFLLPFPVLPGPLMPPSPHSPPQFLPPPADAVPPARKQCDARSCGSPNGVTFFRKQTALPPPSTARYPLGERTGMDVEGGREREREREVELVFLSLKYSSAQCRALWLDLAGPETLPAAADVFRWRAAK